MQLSLSGKSILVTGGAQGLGAAIAEEAAAQRAEKIAIIDRNAEKGAKVAEKLAG